MRSFLKTTALSACFLLPIFMAKAQFTDDFSDGDFTNNPTWSSSNESGNSGDFDVISEQLVSSGPAASATLHITTPTNTTATDNLLMWEFYVNYNNAPSSSNNVEIFLMSDRQDLSNNPIGYFVRLGESGSDDGIDLYKTGSSTAIITDSNPSVATIIDVRIRVTRDQTGNWTLEADPTGGSTFQSVGTAQDNEFIEATYFGFKVEHTSSRAMDFIFDDVSFSTTNTDTTPPSVQMIEVVSENELEITFSESVLATKAEDLSNYDLNNGYGQPSVADRVSPNVVRLSFSEIFQTSDYTLTINAVEDLNGNVATNLTSNFSYFRTEVANLRDIIITEIMADPSPPLSLPESDFIEIYNRSGKAIDLAGWTLADGAGQATLTQYIILSGQYLILTSTSAASAFESYGEVLGLNSFPNFNNAGDDVILRNSTSDLIDQVYYDDSWYDRSAEGGISLERIDPENICGGAGNWSASDDQRGGTPGMINTIFNTGFDSTPPAIANVRAVASNIITIEFSEPVDTLSFSLNDITISPNLGINELSYAETALQLILSENLTSSIEYKILISQANDCVGNLTADLMASVVYIENPALGYRDVVFTEIMANPNDETDLPNAEYLEIFNNTDSQINLSGFKIYDASSSASFPYAILSPQEYLMIIDQDDRSLFEEFDFIEIDGLPSLNNSGDDLKLISNVGEVLDSVNYRSSWYRNSIKDDGGFSLEIIDPTKVCSDESNWIASENDLGGTPGIENSVLSIIPDNFGPQLLTVMGVSADSILLVFDEQLDEVSVFSANYEISAGIDVERIDIVDDRSFYLILTSALLGNTAYSISISGLKDCPGNLIDDSSSSVFYLVEEAEPSDVLINEILFNAVSNGNDFVEIYNNSNKYINLNGWQLANGEFENDSLKVRTKRTISDVDLLMPPSTYFAITDDAVFVQSEYHRSPVDQLIEISTMPSYPDDKGIAIILSRSDTIDYFRYFEEMHSDVIDNDEGVSLERISISRPTNDASNWTSAASSFNYGTPGYENSQIIDRQTSSSRVDITPKIIEPDNDGYADIALITLTFDSPGNLVNLTLFDINGRESKRLVENDYTGLEGVYQWDGTDDSGRQVRPGYYIIFIEIIEQSGTVRKIKEKIAVAYN